MTLGVIEIGRYGYDGISDLGAQIVLGILPNFLQDHGADLRGRIALLANHDGDFILLALLLDLVGDFLDLLAHFTIHAPHKALDGINGIGRVGDGLAFGRLAHETITFLGESDHRRCGAAPFTVLNDHRGATLHHCHTGVGGAQINTDNFAHNVPYL